MMLKRAIIATLFLVVALGGRTSFAQAAPTCTTFDDQNQPAKSFRGGDGIIVRGTGYGTQTTAVVSFRQGVRTAELARIRTTDLGAFSTPDTTKIPATTERGPGSIVVVDGPRSATCEITLAGGAASDEDSSSPTALYIVWGLVLAVGAGFLMFVSLRRWQAHRLKRTMAELAAQPPDSEWLEVARVPADPDRQQSPRVPWLELDDVEIVELSSSDLEPKKRRRKKDAEEDFLLEDDEADEEVLPADVSDDDFDLDDDDFELEDDTPDRPEVRPSRKERRSARKELATPPRLSAEELKTPPKSSSTWERERAQPKRSTSRSVARLRDEVKGWRAD